MVTCNINFQNNTFDVALAQNVIYLLDKPEKALSKLKRIVKSDGIIILHIYITKVENKFLQKIGKTLFAAAVFKPNSWTTEEYLRILNDNNMEIIEYQTFKLKRYECTAIIKNR